MEKNEIYDILPIRLLDIELGIKNNKNIQFFDKIVIKIK